MCYAVRCYRVQKVNIQTKALHGEATTVEGVGSSPPHKEQ